MQIIPAIDLQDGRCVRLRQGRFDTTEVFSDDPLGLAQDYALQGAPWLHIVDLDAAEGKGQDNLAAIERLASTISASLQIGGGLRRTSQLDALFDHGARRLVIGSLAITASDTVRGWLTDFGAERIVLALDVRHANGTPMVMTHGWQRQSDVSLWQAIDTYAAAGLTHLLCTDVERDGMGRGPNLELYEQCRERYPQLTLQASGGIRATPDLLNLKSIGVPYAVVGRALLEGTMSIADAAAC